MQLKSNLTICSLCRFDLTEVNRCPICGQSVLATREAQAAHYCGGDCALGTGIAYKMFLARSFSATDLKSDQSAKSLARDGMPRVRIAISCQNPDSEEALHAEM